MSELDAWLYSAPLDAPDLDLWHFWWSPINGELEEVYITHPDEPRPYGWWRTAEVRMLVERASEARRMEAFA